MNITFPSELMEALQKAGAKSAVLVKDHGYRRTITVDSRYIEPGDVEILRKLLAKKEHAGLAEDPACRRALRKLDEANKLAGKKGLVIRRLEPLADELRSVFEEAPNHWCFTGEDQAWFVERVSYHPPEEEKNYYRPGYVSVELECMVRGEKKERNLHFKREDLPGTAHELLSKKDAKVETKELVKRYEEIHARYVALADETGLQCLAHGEGKIVGAKYDEEKTLSFDREDGPVRVVIDDEHDRKDEAGIANDKFWREKHASEEEDTDVTDEEGDQAPVMLPVQPFLRVFSLADHIYADVHAEFLQEYVYDETLVEKIVLPEETRDLVETLTVSATAKMDDIVKGKARGTIILLEGPPGVGKTLSAEVYSEFAKKALYAVQCSQLGTDEEALEKKLDEVLERANRWGAVLLIDEADVYVRARGDDLQQNAIVGVFLRLLETYRGILFLTTNRGADVDDAILSRCRAVARYEAPQTNQERERLWGILLTNYKVTPSSDLVIACWKTFPHASGRTVRQLIRLGLDLAKGEKLKIEHLKRAAKFVRVEGVPS